nr:hypothetical protein GCM10010200_096300 [Actinomadura rugatobispora]
MGTLVWGPLSMGLLTGRYRKGGPEPRTERMHWVPRHLTDERKLDAVERLIPLAEEAGMPLTHLAMTFAITHPGVTSATRRRTGARRGRSPVRPARLCLQVPVYSARM